MDEYIEREALLKFIENGINNPDRKEAFGYDAVEILEKVQYMPAADVAPVRHGRWVEKEKYTFGIMYDCSLCEDRILDNGHPWNYCPNCGAKMDGGDGNSDMT